MMRVTVGGDAEGPLARKVTGRGIEITIEVKVDGLRETRARRMIVIEERGGIGRAGGRQGSEGRGDVGVARRKGLLRKIAMVKHAKIRGVIGNDDRGLGQAVCLIKMKAHGGVAKTMTHIGHQRVEVNAIEVVQKTEDVHLTMRVVKSVTDSAMKPTSYTRKRKEKSNLRQRKSLLSNCQASMLCRSLAKSALKTSLISNENSLYKTFHSRSQSKTLCSFSSVS